MDTPILDNYIFQIRLNPFDVNGKSLREWLGSYHCKYINNVLTCRTDYDLQCLNAVYIKTCKHMTDEHLLPDGVTCESLVDDTLAKIKQMIADDVYTPEWKPKIHEYQSMISRIITSFREVLPKTQYESFFSYADKVHDSLKTLPEYVQQKKDFKAIRLEEVLALPAGQNRDARFLLLDKVFGL